MSRHLNKNLDASTFHAPWPFPAGNPRAYFIHLTSNGAETKGVSVTLIQVISGMWKTKAGVPASVSMD